MFIVLEGIDGAGKGRQRNEIVALLNSSARNNQEKNEVKGNAKSTGKPHVHELYTTEFPDHQSAIYNQLIHPSLHQEIKLSSSALFISFVLDQLLHEDKILLCRGSKTRHFICDGYFTTNLAFQCLVNKSLSLKDALVLAKILRIPVPDLTIYIDVDPEVAIQRKLKEEGHDEGLDVYESNLNFQKQVRKAYKHLVKKQIFGKWEEVDGNQPIPEIRDRIMELLKSKKLIVV